MSTKSKTEQKNTYEYVPTPVTPAVTEAQTVAQDMRKTVNPRIRSAYAGMRQQQNESFDNPFGAYTTQAVRDASKRNSDLSLHQQEAQALTEADYMANATDFERQMALAQLTAPKLVQTGGTSTATQSGGLAQAALGGVANVAGSWLG